VSAADAGLVLLTVVMAATVAAGLAAGARRVQPGAGRTSGVAAGAAAAILGWLAITAGLASRGLLARYDSVPPRLAFLPLAVIATMLLLSRTSTFARLLVVVPRAWPIALQVFRVPVELLLWGLFLEGRIPERMTFGGWNYDILVGLSAPAVAWAVWRGRLGPVAVAAWNVAGLGLLANIVVIALRSAPGPLDAGWGGVPDTVIAEFPFVWLPAFLVPLAVFGHVTALRQLVRSAPPSAARPR
jgi:hypothetical protein